MAVDPTLLEWAERWYPVSWKGILVAGLLTAVAACATLGFLLLQWRTTSIREEQSEWRTSTLELQTATAKAELVKAQAEIAKANAEIAKAQATVAEANQRTVVLQIQLEQERQKRAPRALTDEQKEALLSELRGRLPEVTFAVQRDLETRAFALQLQIVFQEAGVTIHPYDLPSGDLLAAPAGVVMYKPGGAISEDDLKDDPLYKALEKAGLFGGFVAKPFATLSLSPNTPLLPTNGHVLYVGQKLPW